MLKQTFSDEGRFLSMYLVKQISAVLAVKFLRKNFKAKQSYDQISYIDYTKGKKKKALLQMRNLYRQLTEMFKILFV